MKSALLVMALVIGVSCIYTPGNNKRKDTQAENVKVLDVKQDLKTFSHINDETGNNLRRFLW